MSSPYDWAIEEDRVPAVTLGGMVMWVWEVWVQALILIFEVVTVLLVLSALKDLATHQYARMWSAGIKPLLWGDGWGLFLVVAFLGQCLFAYKAKP